MLRNEGFVSCSCGCGSAMIISYIDQTAYLDFLSSDFFTKQGLLTNLRETAELAFKTASSSKSIILKDIIIDREDLIQLRDTLLKLDLKDDKHKNCSKIRISYDKDIGFSLLLISNLSLLSILQRKRHRAFEYAVGKTERAEIIRQINRVLAVAKI